MFRVWGFLRVVSATAETICALKGAERVWGFGVVGLR